MWVQINTPSDVAGRSALDEGRTALAAGASRPVAVVAVTGGLVMRTRLAELLAGDGVSSAADIMNVVKAEAPRPVFVYRRTK